MSPQATFRTVEVKLYPTRSQAAKLTAWLRVCCRIYNRALDHRRLSYKRRSENVSLYDQYVLLTKWRSRIREVRMVPVQFGRDALRRLDNAYAGFFQRCKEGAKKKGYPRFKKDRQWKSLECLKPDRYYRAGMVHVPSLGLVRCRGRKVEGVQKSLRLIQRESGWYAQLLVVGPPSLSPVLVQSVVGIDVGLTIYAALSTGEKVENPRFFRKSERKLRIFQRRASRKRKGSHRRRKASSRIARIHERIRGQRKGFVHQLSRSVVNRFDFVGIEDLNLQGLSRGVLAKHVRDASWGLFTFFLLYKAASAGKQVVKVDPRGTSQECPRCGRVCPKLLSERVHRCECGLVLDRDVAAALVILARALAVAGVSRPWRGPPLALGLIPALSGPDEAGRIRPRVGATTESRQTGPEAGKLGMS